MSDVIQYAKVIEPCVYKNEFYEVDDIITGTEEEIDIVTGSDNELQEILDFGYAEVYDGPIEAPVVEEEPVEETPIEEPESDGKKTAKK